MPLYFPEVPDLPIGSDDAFKLLEGLFPPESEGFVETRLIGPDRRVLQDFYAVQDRNFAYLRNTRRGVHMNVYVGVAPRTRKEGTKDAVGLVHSVWVDLDRPGVATDLAFFELPPSAVVASGSPGHLHAYFFLKDGVAPAEAERINRALAEQLGGDLAATDASRVMRLPGTYNFKTDPPVKATLLDCSGVRYSLDAIEQTLGLDQGPEGEPATAGSSPNGELSVAVARTLELLHGVTPTSNGWTAHCPAHDDQHPSLSIAEGDDGRCLLRCHTGCSVEEIVAAIGLRISDLFEGGDRNVGGSVASQLVTIVERAGANLFHDPKGRAFVEIPVGERNDVWPVESRSFRRWLRREMHQAHDRVASATGLIDAVELLCAKAEFDGPQREVFVRIAQHGEGVLIDLTDDDWRVLEVLPGSWQIVPRSPVPFIRSGAALPLPTPVEGGSLDELREFLNLSDERDWPLVVAFLISTLSGRGPFPVLILQGEKGSGKSTAARVIRLLTDPATGALRAGTPTERDLMIRAATNWVVAFDNLSGISSRLSDVLCQLSTGAGFGTRRLYTDDEEIIFDAMRPIMLNGIADLATRPDLLSRAVVIELRVLEEAKIEPEADFWKRFEAATPRILGALVDLLSEALAVLPEVKLDRSPRMADFARLGVAVERVLEWPEGSFLRAQSGQQADAFTASLDADPIAPVLLSFMRERSAWTGSASELLHELTSTGGEDVTRRRAWPSNASVLSKRLKALLPALREVSLAVDWGSSGRDRGKHRALSVSWASVDAGDAGDGT